MTGSELPSPRAGRIWTIPAHRPFLADLAAGLSALYPDPLSIARLTVLLPGRRAARALTDAFVALSARDALLLPRLVAIADLDGGDLEEEALGTFLAQAETDPGPGLQPDPPPPAVDPLARLVILARLLASGRPAAPALALAPTLAAALDTLVIEGRDPADLAGAGPETMQAHWHRNTILLETVARHWPAVLAERGFADPVARREALLARLAARWAANPPAKPLVMAGFASAPPSVARLAGAILNAGGSLVLPALAQGLDADGWAAIEGAPGHAQHGMARLLAGAGRSPLEAEEWPHRAPGVGSPPERAHAVARALEPDIGADGPVIAQPMAGVSMIACATAAEEARVIALALRQVADCDGLTAALVTPDRALARRVAIGLRRFGIAVDDSAGEPLSTALPGALLVALATAAAEGFAPVPLLSVLTHPLTAAGEGRLSWLNAVRTLDARALRGIRPGRGLAGLDAVMPAAVSRWWRDQARPALQPLEPLPTDAATLIEAVLEAAEALAGDALWQGEGGRALSALLETLAPVRADLAGIALTAGEAAPLLSALLATRTVRPIAPRHPRIAIWGPLEARLQSPDLLVLGGLNEGVWPRQPAPDPFLAPAIRRALDLPGLDRQTGLQAHDLLTGMGAREVLLTRSLREGSAPAVPSRYWLRLEAAGAGAAPSGAGSLLPGASALLEAARALDLGQLRPADRPAPAPPLAVRPRKLRVTDIDLLAADPFHVYARHILRLTPWERHDIDPTAAERGTALHRILERWVRNGAHEADLERIVDDELARLGSSPGLVALWRPRILRACAFVRDCLVAQPEWSPAAFEVSGSLDLGGVTVVGKADRIDCDASGALRILDYKSGALPPVGEVQNGKWLQLPLLGAIATDGGFAGLRAARVLALDYLKLGGGREAGQCRPALGNRAPAPPVPSHIEAARDRARALVQRYCLADAPFTARADMLFAGHRPDYEHFARLGEWIGRVRVEADAPPADAGAA